MATDKRCKCGLPALPYSGYCRGHFNDYQRQRREAQRAAVHDQIKGFTDRPSRRHPKKAAANQKWRKYGNSWRHDNLPIWIVGNDEGLYQVRYLAESKHTKKVKGGNGWSWYRLNVAKRLARDVETTMQEAKAS